MRTSEFQLNAFASLARFKSTSDFALKADNILLTAYQAAWREIFDDKEIREKSSASSYLAAVKNDMRLKDGEIDIKAEMGCGSNTQQLDSAKINLFNHYEFVDSCMCVFQRMKSDSFADGQDAFADALKAKLQDHLRKIYPDDLAPEVLQEQVKLGAKILNEALAGEVEELGRVIGGLDVGNSLDGRPKIDASSNVTVFYRKNREWELDPEKNKDIIKSYNVQKLWLGDSIPKNTPVIGQTPLGGLIVELKKSSWLSKGEVAVLTKQHLAGRTFREMPETIGGFVAGEAELSTNENVESVEITKPFLTPLSITSSTSTLSIMDENIEVDDKAIDNAFDAANDKLLAKALDIFCALDDQKENREQLTDAIKIWWSQRNEEGIALDLSMCDSETVKALPSEIIELINPYLTALALPEKLDSENDVPQWLNHLTNIREIKLPDYQSETLDFRQFQPQAAYKLFVGGSAISKVETAGKVGVYSLGASLEKQVRVHRYDIDGVTERDQETAMDLSLITSIPGDLYKKIDSSEPLFNSETPREVKSYLSKEEDANVGKFHYWLQAGLPISSDILKRQLESCKTNTERINYLKANSQEGSGRQIAMQEGHIDPLKQYNEIVRWTHEKYGLTSEGFKSLYPIDKSHWLASKNEHFDCIAVDNTMSFYGHRNKLLNDNEFVERLLSDYDISCYPIHVQEDHGKSILRIYGDGVLTDQQLHKLVPDKAWLREHCPIDYLAANIKRELDQQARQEKTKAENASNSGITGFFTKATTFISENTANLPASKVYDELGKLMLEVTRADVSDPKLVTGNLFEIKKQLGALNNNNTNFMQRRTCIQAIMTTMGKLNKLINPIQSLDVLGTASGSARWLAITLT